MPRLVRLLCTLAAALIARRAGIPPAFSDIEMRCTDLPNLLPTGDLVEAIGSATNWPG